MTAWIGAAAIVVWLVAGVVVWSVFVAMGCGFEAVGETARAPGAETRAA